MKLVYFNLFQMIDYLEFLSHDIYPVPFLLDLTLKIGHSPVTGLLLF